MATLIGTGPERFAIRYLVHDDALPGLVRALQVRLEPDPHGGERGTYRVTTLYCEPGGDGSPARRRLRIRTLEDSKGARTFVEIRHHVGRRSWKLRAEASPEQALAACHGEWTEGSPRLLQEAAALARELRLAPACLVSCERRAFLAGASDPPDLRVTIDSNLRHRNVHLSVRPDEAGWQPTLPAGAHLVEVRVARAIPGWLLRTLERFGCREHVPGRRHLARIAV